MSFSNANYNVRQKKMPFCAKLGMEIKLQIFFSGLWLCWAVSVKRVKGKNVCLITHSAQDCLNGISNEIMLGNKKVLRARQQQTGE